MPVTMHAGARCSAAARECRLRLCAAGRQTYAVRRSAGRQGAHEDTSTCAPPPCICPVTVAASRTSLRSSAHSV